MKAFDALIVGAGPAGCASALWLAQMGYRVAVVEAKSSAFSALKVFDFSQSWVISHGGQSLRQVALDYEQQLLSQANIQFFYDEPSIDPLQIKQAAFIFELRTGQRLRASALVVATGLRARRLPAHITDVATREKIWNAIELTQHKAQVHGKQVLLLGSGDNAAENALALSKLGNKVTVWSRSAWSAQQQYVVALASQTSQKSIKQRLMQTLPNKITSGESGALEVMSERYGKEQFDCVAALLGFEPEQSFWKSLITSTAWLASNMQSANLNDYMTHGNQGIFVAGDISARMHPCVQTALADGVVAAKQVQTYLETNHE